jgi:hypothetical protein
MGDPEWSQQRRVAAVGAMIGGALMALGLLLPWAVYSTGSTTNGFSYVWWWPDLVLGCSTAVVGAAAFMAAARGRVWVLLIALASISLVVLVVQFRRGGIAISSSEVGFPTTAVGAAIALASGVRGAWLQDRQPR